MSKFGFESLGNLSLGGNQGVTGAILPPADFAGREKELAGLGGPRKAIAYYQQQLTVARELGDRRGEANALMHIGIAYKQLGKPRQAIEHYEQALPLLRELGDRRGEGLALGDLGLACATLAEMRQAIGYFERCLPILREVGDRQGEGLALWHMSLLLDLLREPVQTIMAHAEAALAIYEQIEDPHVDMVRRQLGVWRAKASRPWWQFWV